MKKKIKLFDPIIDNKELLALEKTLKSKLWANGAGGKQVVEFEKKILKKINSDYNIAVNSGTAALYLSLSMENIQNKEVILPSMSFVSTAHAVTANNAKPVFADINLDTLCIEPEEIEKSVTKSTKIILPVHFAGMPSDLKRIQKICHKKNLTLIEDAAHAIGSYFNGKHLGNRSDVAAFSFSIPKIVTTGQGGMVITNNKKIYEYKVH